MQKRANFVVGIGVDEVSPVDIPANQESLIVFSKRADKEETMPDVQVPNELFDLDGQPVTDESQLVNGEIYVDEAGNAFEWIADSADVFDGVEDREPELAGVTKNFGASIRSELSKAHKEGQLEEVIAKAADEIAKADARAQKAEEIAKSERDLRLNREYISKAAEFAVGVDPSDLGPVLKRMAETMSYEDCAVINKALTSATEAVFNSLGTEGLATNGQVFDEIDSYITKSMTGEANISKAEAMTNFFAQNPEAYDDYMSDKRNNR